MPSSHLAPVPRTTLPETVADRLRRAIVAGELAGGAALTEPVLATRFGVSRAPVREALILLERERLVEFTAAGRTRVRELTGRDLEEIITLRGALESLAARLAAARWTAADTAWVEANLQAQRGSRTIEDLDRLDLDLHEYILRAADHGRLLDAWKTLRPQVERWLAAIFRVQQRLRVEPREVTVANHRKLLEAVASGNPETAARAAADHVEIWRRWADAGVADRIA